MDTDLDEMPSCLQKCPNELIENIVTQLSLDGIRSLRLTCRSLAQKSSQQHFGLFFRRKEIRLNKHSLETFVDLARPEGLGCLVEDLTLVGEASIDAEHDAPLDVGTEEVELLARVFQRLAVNGKDGTLPSLSLSVVSTKAGVDVSSRTRGIRYSLEKHVGLDLADWMLSATMDALALSRLKLLKFNAFYTCNRERAGPPCSKFANIDFGSEGIRESFSSLTHLKFKLADPTTEDAVRKRAAEADHPHNCALALGLERYAGMSKLLSTCPQLSVLWIDYYRLNWKSQGNQAYHECLFKQLATRSALPSMNLRRLALIGLDVAASDLLGFLKYTSACQLIMQRVNISTGPIMPLLEYVGDPNSALRGVCILYPSYRSGMLTFGHGYSGSFSGNKKSGKRITEYRIGYDPVTMIGV